MKVMMIVSLLTLVGCASKTIQWERDIGQKQNDEAYCQGIKRQAIIEHKRNIDEMYLLCMQSKGYTPSN